jgi:putative RNA 2'-phosphotransferase
MDEHRATRISKFLSLVLRHRPAAAEVALDAEGWVTIAALLSGAARHGMLIHRNELDYVVATNEKRRFAVSPDGRRIRANQGHSIAVDLGLARQEPPARLYHGTVERFLAGILARGLQKKSRQHVHLSPDEATARRVGQRRGEPVILEIAAAEMHMAGHVFYRSANDVWLTGSVPPAHIKVLAMHESAPTPSGTPVAVEREG